jgi:molybdate transport system regulatory protein
MTRLTIRIDFDSKRHVGHGKIRLLELIGEHGSISGAAREMKMSYRRAWLLADEVNRMFSEPVLETQHGGAGGGHARLTTFGHALVGHYRAIETQALKSFNKQIVELERRLRPATPAAPK